MNVNTSESGSRDNNTRIGDEGRVNCAEGRAGRGTTSWERHSGIIYAGMIIGSGSTAGPVIGTEGNGALGFAAVPENAGLAGSLPRSSGALTSEMVGLDSDGRGGRKQKAQVQAGKQFLVASIIGIVCGFVSENNPIVLLPFRVSPGAL